MKPLTFSPTELTLLKVLAAFGFLVPNGVFCYYVFTDPALALATLRNPIALVFVTEAFGLMALFAWLLKKVGSQKPSGTVFVLMSLIGSMAFSVPAALYLMWKPRGQK